MQTKNRFPPMKRLKIMRISRDMTQAELAEKAGMHRNAIMDYESGKHQPRLDNLQALATALECSIDEIQG